MTKCKESGVRIEANFWPPAVQVGYADVKDSGGICTETTYGLQAGLFNNFSNLFRGLQLGVVNSGDNVKGVAIGAVNVHKKISGVHVGLWNYAFEEAKTVGVGVVNQSAGDLIGAHVGLVNLARGTMEGFQASFWNSNQERPFGYSNTKGLQIGGLNKTEGSSSGFQVGMINSAWHNMTGLQVAILNMVDMLGNMENGLHFGIFNSAEKMNNGAVGVFNFSENCKYFTPFTGAFCLFGPAEKKWHPSEVDWGG